MKNLNKGLNKDLNKNFSVFLRCATKAEQEKISWFNWAIAQLAAKNKTPVLALLSVQGYPEHLITGMELLGVEFAETTVNTGFKDNKRNDIISKMNVSVKKGFKAFDYAAMQALIEKTAEKVKAEKEVAKEAKKEAKKAEKANALQLALQAENLPENLAELAKSAARKAIKKPNVAKLQDDLQALELWASELELATLRGVLKSLVAATHAVTVASGEEAGEFTLTTDLQGTKQGIAH